MLLDAGHDVVCLARDPSKFIGIPWSDRATIVKGDVLDRRSLDRAVDRVDTVYYLVHSIGTSGDFSESDRAAAVNLADAAVRAGVECGSQASRVASPHTRTAPSQTI